MEEPVQQSVEDLLRPMSTDPDRSESGYYYPATPPAVEFAVAVVFAMFSPLLVDAPIGALSHSGGGRGIAFIAFTLAAAAGVRLGLLAIWLAWGQWRVVWRLPVVVPSVAFSAILWAGGSEREWSRMMPAMMFIVLGTALAAATPRLFGVYRTNLFDAPWVADGAKVQEGQFRLLDMFAWTATAGVVAGMMRWIGLPREWEWIMVIIMLPVASLMTLSALWATLTKRALIFPRVLVAFGVVFGIAMILGTFTGGDPEAMFYLFYTLMLAMGLLLGALYVARCIGIRLVSRSLPLIAPPQSPPNKKSPAAIAPGLE